MGSEFKIFIQDKEEGVTSFSSLNPIKHHYKKEKVGHAGTLDKFASGLMLCLVGNATKLNPIFSSFDKSYEGTIQFGSETSTLDPEGEIVKESRIPSKEEVEESVKSFIGRQKQIPPIYSAIHVDGKRAYKEAREGVNLVMPERDVEIYDISLLSYDSNKGIAKIYARVSKGTYIRSLARDISYKANSTGHLINLRRLTVGPYSLNDKDLSTKELLDKTQLFSSIYFDKKYKKEIDNGKIEDYMILSDSDSAKNYAYAYFDDSLYAIIKKEERIKVISRLNGNI